MTEQVVSKLVDDLKASEVQAQDAFEALARAIAEDNCPPIAEVKSILHDSGKTPDDLEREIRTWRRVAELEGIVAGEGDLEKERAEFQRERSEVLEKLKERKMSLHQEAAKIEGEFASREARFRIRRNRVRNARDELEALLHPPQPEPPKRSVPEVRHLPVGPVGIGPVSD